MIDNEMRCEQARQLFDAYLDGELSGALATELGAHRVKCPECRRALALMEVSGHIVASDRDPVMLHGEFADRLLACADLKPARSWDRLRRGLYIAGPLAAAAVVALAVLGAFDRPVRFAGKLEKGQPRPDVSPTERPPEAPDTGRSLDEHLLEEWLKETRENLAAKVESGESFQRHFELTISQMLDILKQAREASDGADHIPGADGRVPASAPQPTPADDEDVEDL